MIRTRPMRLTGPQAALLLATLFALFWRAIIPGGFMPVWQDGGIVVTVCTEQGVVTTVLNADGAPQDSADTTGTLSTPCTFASLSLPLLPAAPMALLAIALAFVLLSGRRFAAPAPHRAALWLRPPLRAPPAPAFA